VSVCPSTLTGTRPEGASFGDDNGMGVTFILSAGADVCKVSTCAWVVLASPLQEGRERGFIAQSRHADQEPFDFAQGRHHPRSKGPSMQKLERDKEL
jgi:hypothetical protein